MLNLNVIFTKMSDDEINHWLEKAYIEKGKAYDDDNLSYVRTLDMIIDGVKTLLDDRKNVSAIGESFKTYSTKKYIYEHTETGPTCEMFEVDEDVQFLKENLPDIDIDIEATGTVNGTIVTSLDPIVVDLAFNLPFIEEQQHITLTYNTTSTINIDLNSIPRKDYQIMNTDDGTIVSFINFSNLADELENIEFSQTIEWPFEIKFKTDTPAKKFAKADTLAQKIVALLGKEKLINKVADYKSTHQSGSGRATRAQNQAKKEEEAIRRTARANAGKTKTQIMTELLQNINGVTEVISIDTGNDVYYKAFRVRITNGKVYEILMARILTQEELDNDKKPFMCRPLGEPLRAQRFDNRTDVINWLTNIINAADQLELTPRERSMRRAQGQSLTDSLSATYNKYVDEGNKFIEGTSTLSIDELEQLYNKLMDNEDKLSDEQMTKISDICSQLDEL